MTRILLLEPDAARRAQLRGMLEEREMEVIDASDCDALTTAAFADIDIAISNAQLSSSPGIAIRRRIGDVPLILFAENASVRSAVEAMQQGACDYLAAPFEPAELIDAINRSVAHRGPGSVAMVGHSRAMLELVERISALGPTQRSLLIIGESGSGKELAARALHAASRRRARPMISLNCATIPHALLESELFGDDSTEGEHRLGLVEAADHGTLFLDEISALTLEAQVRLLDVLQNPVAADAANQRNGGRFDIRLLAATHRDLAPLVEAGRFLEELYVRLAATTLTIPPLRDRGTDVIELSNWLLQRVCRKLAKPTLELSAGAAAAISQYSWPGNVRELENALERAAILCAGTVIEADLLAIDSTKSAPHAPAMATEETDTQPSLEGYFVKFVLEHQDALTETELAQKLGISRKSLWERRQRLNIPRKRTRTRAPRRDGDL